MGGLPSHLVVGGLLRAAEAGGGNGTILSRGDADAGAILLVLTYRGEAKVVTERVSNMANGFTWNSVMVNESQPNQMVARLIDEKTRFDRDLWIVELDVADVEQFIVDSLWSA